MFSGQFSKIFQKSYFSEHFSTAVSGHCYLRFSPVTKIFPHTHLCCTLSQNQHFAFHRKLLSWNSEFTFTTNPILVFNKSLMFQRYQLLLLLKTLFTYSQIFYWHNFANKHNRSWQLSLYPLESFKDKMGFKLVFLQDNVTYLMNLVNTSHNKINLIFCVIILHVVSTDKFLTIEWYCFGIFSLF